MSITGLDITTNTEEGRLANERGDLTMQQYEWLVKQLKNPFQPPTPLPTKNEMAEQRSSFIIMLVTSAVVSGLIEGGHPGSGLAAFLLFQILYLVMYLFSTLSIVRLWNRLRYFTRMGPHLLKARRQLANGDYQIESWDGQVRFDMYPPRAFEMFGTTSAEQTYVLKTRVHTFPVSKALWDALRLDAKQDFSLHYLTEPFVTLLSVVPILRSEPPSDSELASVIGISDDGELIYEEQDGEARHQL